MGKFVIYHQPKTGGTWAANCLPPGYVLPHNQNYNAMVKNYSVTQVKPVCIVRDPLDYYISLSTFWCIDPKYCSAKFARASKSAYQEYIRRDVPHAHVNFVISEGYTIRDIHTLLSRFFDDSFIRKHTHVLSKAHHTYDYCVFAEMDRLDIGYYTFAFLDQCSRKKITDLRDGEDVLTELTHIRDHFEVLHTACLEAELKALCQKYGVPFKNSPRAMQSARKAVDEYDFDASLCALMAHKERYMLAVFSELRKPDEFSSKNE